MIDETLMERYEMWIGNREAEISRAKVEIADFKVELKALEKVEAILESIPTPGIDVKQFSVRAGKITLMIKHREELIQSIKESMKHEKKVYNFLKRNSKTTENILYGKMAEKAPEGVENIETVEEEKKGKK
jgi:hypothetical protein